MNRYVLALVLVAASVEARAADWKPLDPADLALKAPKVQADADAEAILWEVRVSDELSMIEFESSTVFDHYLRVKIFTDRGRDAFATVEIPYTSGMQVRDVAARTVRPDGSIVELKRGDVYQRTIVKAEDLRVKAVSFAVPAIERGAIVEYRWREVHYDSLANYLRLPFSRDIPVHTVRYFIRPLSLLLPDFGMKALSFNGTFSPPQRQKDGFTMISLSDVPADRDEAYSSPRLERGPWLFIYYESRSPVPDAAHWERFSKDLHEEYASRSKPNADIRTLATQSVTGAKTDAERVAALVRASRARVRRIDIDTADRGDRRKARDNKNAGDALKRGIGGEDDIVVVFLALAKAAGLDARIVAAPNRAELFHRAIYDNPYFVRGRLVGIRAPGGWTFVDPANEHSETGDLRWYYEWQEVLIGDSGQVTTARTPLSPPSRSAKRRIGTFRLDEDGTLEGECRIVYSGHWGDTIREQEDQDAAAERERSLRELITKRLPGAEVSAVTIEHVTDLAGPYTNSYHIRVPGYAQRSGSRLFLQPAVFQRGVDALLPTASRVTDVYFPFPWIEEDDVTIALPPGFELEQPERPTAIDAGPGRYELRVARHDRSAHLRLLRTLTFGLNEAILFPVTSYPSLKMFFDRVHTSDGHTLVLRREEGGS
jgi:transglutaminase-like putative cysteine protease